MGAACHFHYRHWALSFTLLRRNRNVARARTTKKSIECTGSNWLVSYCAYINGGRDITEMQYTSFSLDCAYNYYDPSPTKRVFSHTGSIPVTSAPSFATTPSHTPRRSNRLKHPLRQVRSPLHPLRPANGTCKRH